MCNREHYQQCNNTKASTTTLIRCFTHCFPLVFFSFSVFGFCVIQSAPWNSKAFCPFSIRINSVVNSFSTKREAMAILVKIKLYTGSNFKTFSETKSHSFLNSPSFSLLYFSRNLYINAEAVISLPLFTCSFQIWNILQ